MERTDDGVELVRRALAHMQRRSTDMAPEPMALPVEAYVDPDRYRREVEAIFGRLPLALALSIELPEPGCYRTMSVIGRPVLIARDREGRARAFLNACRHRGSPVCEEARGKTPRFVCPYHGWTYDLQGRLEAIYAPDTFGAIDPADFGLTALPCAESHGLVWVSLTPGAQFDITDWLAGFGDELASLKLDQWHLYDQRELDGPGWKVAWDGYLEAYHHNTLHVNTVGKYTIGNLLLLDTYGPHQRIVFARRTLRELVDKPESEWDAAVHLRKIHSVFPNLSISGVLGDHCLVSQVFPGPTPATTVTRQTVLAAKKPESESERAATDAFSTMVRRAVEEEDYRIGRQIQAGIGSGANRAFVFGRNEPALQHYHRFVAQYASAGAP